MAFCPRCAAPNADSSATCAACGAPLSAPPGIPNAGAPPTVTAADPALNLAPRTNGLAIAGFVCAFLCALVGLILSIVAYNQCKKSNGQLKGQGLALAGIIIASCMLFLSVVLQVIAVASK